MIEAKQFNKLEYQSQIDYLVKDLFLTQTILSLEIEIDDNGRLAELSLETTEGSSLTINHHAEVEIK